MSAGGVLVVERLGNVESVDRVCFMHLYHQLLALATVVTGATPVWSSQLGGDSYHCGLGRLNGAVRHDCGVQWEG